MNYESEITPHPESDLPLLDIFLENSSENAATLEQVLPPIPPILSTPIPPIPLTPTEVAPLIPPIATATEANDNQDPPSQPNETSNSLAEIEATLVDLKQMFEQRFRYDQAKEKAFDTLYDKMKQHERGFQASLKENLVFSLLLLYDNMERTEADLRQHQESAGDRVALLKQELLNILYAENVEPVGNLDAFDRQRQKPVRIVATDDPTQHDSIEQIIREGFVVDERVIRPQSVVLRRYNQPQNTTTTHSGEP